MPKIPLEVSATGLSHFDQVQQKVRAIAGAEKEAAAAATLRVKAQGGGGGGSGGGGQNGHVPNPHHGGGGGQGGAHSGFLGMLHRSSRAVGGEFGHVAHRGSALGAIASAGPLGIAVVGAGLALNTFISAQEHAAERVKEIAERSHEYATKIYEAGETLGKRGLAAAGESGGLRQLINQGMLQAFQEAKAKGFGGSAESFAGMGYNPMRWKAAMVAEQFGATGDAAARAAANLPRSGFNATTAGRGLAQTILNRRITDGEFNRWQDNQGTGKWGQLDAIAATQGKTANIGYDNAFNGKGLGVAQQDFAQAKDPEGYATLELQKESQRKADVLNKMSDAAGTFSEILKDAGMIFGGQGSYAQQARVENATNSASMPPP